MSTYRLSITTPDGHVLDEEVESIVAPAYAGYLGVLAHHTPMVAALVPGVLTVRTTDSARRFRIGEGLLEVGPDGVNILADRAAPAETPPA
jgi:F-type H+-transporting ATPase subunit epsilon